MDEIEELKKYNDEDKRSKKKTDDEKTNQKPNMFVSLQVDNPDIQKAMACFQQACLDFDPCLSDFLVPVRKAHITLLVFHVAKNRLEEAKDIFKSVIEEQIVGQFEGEDIFEVEFSGIGAFDGNKVIFAEPKTNTDRMIFINDKLYQAFTDKQFNCDKKFNAHLTLLKKGYKRKKNVQKVPLEAYKDIKDSYFGIQEISGIQLLSMSKPQTKEGYYFCEAEYKFRRKTPLENLVKELHRKRESVKRRTRDNVTSALESVHGSNAGLVIAGLVAGAAILWSVRRKC